MDIAHHKPSTLNLKIFPHKTQKQKRVQGLGSQIRVCRCPFPCSTNVPTGLLSFRTRLVLHHLQLPVGMDVRLVLCGSLRVSRIYQGVELDDRKDGEAKRKTEKRRDGKNERLQKHSTGTRAQCTKNITTKAVSPTWQKKTSFAMSSIASSSTISQSPNPQTVEAR